MSEENTVTGDPLSVSSEGSRPEAGGTGQQLPVVSERASDGELAALKAAHAEEMAALREQIAGLRDAVKAHLSAASEFEESGGPPKTAGVKELRQAGPRAMLSAAASAAQQSGHRADVQAYMRVRRGRV